MASRSSTATIFVFLVTFLGIFAILVNAIPTDFFTPSALEEIKTRTEWFPDVNIGYLNYTDSCNLTKGGYEELKVGDIEVTIQWDHVLSLPDIWFEHRAWVVFWWVGHWFDGMPITLTDLIDHQTEDFANRSYFILTCSCPKTYNVYFVYNSTTYSSWSEAYTGGELEVYVGMGWNDAIERQNAWSLIWSILLFQAPEVFGTGAAATTMNAIIAVPLWAAFAIIGAIMILWFIPFLGGE